MAQNHAKSSFGNFLSEKEKAAKKSGSGTGGGSGDFSLTDSERKQIVITLASMPKDAELKIAKAIISGKFSDKQLKPLIDALIDNEKPNIILRIYERITGDRSLTKISAEKHTGEEFAQRQRSFSYLFQKNIMPVLSMIAGAVIVLFIILALLITVIWPTMEASTYYNLGKKNLREKRFYDVETNFEKGWNKQPRYSEAVEYAALYQKYKRYLEAEKKYFLAMKMKPNTELKMQIADFFSESKDFERSIKYYNDVLKADKKNFKAALGKAKTYVRWSDEEKDKIADAKEAYLDVLDADHQQRGGRAGAPAFSDNFEVPGEQLQTIEREASIVLGIFVERVAEGRHQVQVAAGGEHAAEFAADATGIAHVLQDGVAFHALEDGVGKR